EKLVLWAHNYHVGTAYAQTMGTWLRGTFGTDMVIFGFVFDQGSFNAVPLPGGGGPKPHSVPQWPGTGGVEEMFQKTALPRFILDLRNIESTSAKNYFNIARTVWTIGAAFNGNTSLDVYREPLVLPRAYDAIIWFEQTTPSALRGF
ncbi:MAG TPA: erythromycin esterase family protein, partial [Thermoanaerobaculia bacterium]